MKLQIQELNQVFEQVFESYPLNFVNAVALRFFFLNPYHRALIVDAEGAVQFMDPYSERALGLAPGQAKGMRVEELLPNSALPKVLKTGKPLMAGIFEVRGRKMINAAFPLWADDQLVGAVGRILFHSLEEFERIYEEIKGNHGFIRGSSNGLAKEHKAKYTLNDIIFVSSKMGETVEMARRLSKLGVDVLIFGETGTGKELLAHGIHNESGHYKPFVKVNCAALPSELAESELFGYEKGSFTGALSSGKIGCFEAANGGTIFLDEISALPERIQAKLLRTLQEREIVRIGNTRPKKLEFRVIAATNVDLRSLVEKGRFRADLYHRIARTVLEVPPLRDRREDIEIYVNHFLRVACESFGLKPKKVEGKAMERLVEYNWPGNVRELINVIDQAVIRAWDESEISEKHLPTHILASTSKYKISSSEETRTKFRSRMKEIERDFILEALKASKGNRKLAAAILGMPKSTFYEKLKSYGLTSGRK